MAVWLYGEGAPYSTPQQAVDALFDAVGGDSPFTETHYIRAVNGTTVNTTVVLPGLYPTKQNQLVFDVADNGECNWAVGANYAAISLHDEQYVTIKNIKFSGGLACVACLPGHLSNQVSFENCVVSGDVKYFTITDGITTIGVERCNIQVSDTVFYYDGSNNALPLSILSIANSLFVCNNFVKQDIYNIFVLVLYHCTITAADTALYFANTAPPSIAYIIFNTIIKAGNYIIRLGTDFSTLRVYTSFLSSNYNIYWTNGGYFGLAPDGQLTFLAYQTGTGCDNKSIFTDPLLDSNYYPTATSPAIQGGSYAGGLSLNGVDRNIILGAPDVGCYQTGGYAAEEQLPLLVHQNDRINIINSIAKYIKERQFYYNGNLTTLVQKYNLKVGVAYPQDIRKMPLPYLAVCLTSSNPRTSFQWTVSEKEFLVTLYGFCGGISSTGGEAIQRQQQSLLGDLECIFDEEKSGQNVIDLYDFSVGSAQNRIKIGSLAIKEVRGLAFEASPAEILDVSRYRFSLTMTVGLYKPQ